MDHKLLTQNIVTIANQRGISLRQLERDAGVHRNFISNLIRDRSKNPGIDAIIKITTVLNVSIDELIGRKKSAYDDYNPSITQKDMLFDIVDHLSVNLKSKQNSEFKLKEFLNAIHEIYAFSLEKGHFDKEFANWLIKTKLSTIGSI